MGRRALLLALSAALLAWAPLSGQSTRELRGVVLADDASKPLAEVLVTVAFDDGRPPVTTSSQADGRFTFQGLQPGRVTVSAIKSGFVPLLYGARERGAPGLTLALGAGTAQPDIVLRLPRGATMSGRVTDITGSPLAGVAVTALERRVLGSDARFLRSNGSITDDQGRFRIFGLAPGEYLVAALLAGGVGRGTSLPSAEFRLAAPSISAGIPSPIFYPGTPLPAEAGLVTVGVGEERQGINFSVSRAMAAELVARLATPRGLTLTGAEVVIQTDPRNVGIALGDLQNRRIEPTGGAFSVSLLPGRYTLVAHARANVAGARGAKPADTDRHLWAVSQLEVPDNKFVGLPPIELRPGAAVSGRAAFQVAAPLAPDGPSPAAIRLVPGSRRTPSFSLPVSPVGADGRFSFASVPPGRYFVDAVMPARSVWRVSDIRRGALDLAIDAIDVGENGSVDDIVATITDRRTEVTLTVVAGAGRLPHEFFVAVFPVNARYWSANYRHRRAPMRPDDKGVVVIRDLPAGDYYVALLSEWRNDLDSTPEEMARLVPAAMRFSLKDGDRLAQTLQVATP